MALCVAIVRLFVGVFVLLVDLLVFYLCLFDVFVDKRSILFVIGFDLLFVMLKFSECPCDLVSFGRMCGGIEVVIFF